MPRIQAGDIELNYIEHGSGDKVVLAVHGNLGCAHWLDLALPLLPANLRIIAAEWRGCGDSDKPEPTADYSNYTMQTHAADQVSGRVAAAWDAYDSILDEIDAVLEKDAEAFVRGFVQKGGQ